MSRRRTHSRKKKKSHLDLNLNLHLRVSADSSKGKAQRVNYHTLEGHLRQITQVQQVTPHRDQVAKNMRKRKRKRKMKKEKRKTLDLVPKDWWRLDSSKASTVAEGEASPPPSSPLHESGVVGLALMLFVESPSFTLSHLIDLDLGCRIPHLRAAAIADFATDVVIGNACVCFNLINSSTTTLSSVIAALTHSSFIIVYKETNAPPRPNRY